MTQSKILTSFLLACFSFVGNLAAVEEIQGKVVAVYDGDTFTLKTDRESMTICLDGIDAPERGQSFGPKSRDALKALILNRQVTIKKIGTDKHKRTLGIVMVAGEEVNGKMVKDGWAWRLKKPNDDETLARFEEEARTAGRGLWEDTKTPVAPWEYREAQSKAVVKSSPTERPKAVKTTRSKPKDLDEPQMDESEPPSDF
jgi:endonuclease YncB( thermonuclease family)